tara:strand:+ start:3843 stop:5369 length:1527 start_codon:yes stop_codon:yes gene_type:complete
MSLENIKRKVKAKLKTENKKFATTYFNKNLQGTKLVEFIWGTDALIDGCKIGATEVLDRLLAGKIIDSQTHASYMSHNISNNWVRYAKQISKTAKQNKFIGGVGFTKYTKGMVMNTPYPMYQANFSDMKIKRPKTWSLLLLIPGAQTNAERTLKILYDNLVQELWIAFVNDISSVFGPNAILPTTSIPPRKGKKNKRSVLNVLKQSGLKKEHSRPTTRALQAIQSLKTTKLGFNAGLKLKEHDLYAQTIKALGVKLEQNQVKRRAGTYGVKNVIQLTMGKNYAFGTTDIANVRKEYLAAVEKAFQDDKKLLNPKATMSTPIATQATEDVISSIIDKLVNRQSPIKQKKGIKRSVKSKAKKFKDGKRVLDLITPAESVNIPVVDFSINIPGKLGRAKRVAGKKEKSFTLAELKGKINRSLPAEVRRNMGRPALINRTSTFSNSVVLSSLREGPNTLIGEYTYQLDPYSTFENLGVKQWPNGYNPKPLIAKSIRNLAQRHVEAQFTLRRV